jgi:cytochrome c
MRQSIQFNHARSAAVALVAVTSVFAMSVGPMAKDLPPPSPVKGHELALRLCAGCHLIDGSDTTTLPAGIPTFRGIANKSGQTGQHITDKLIKPHLPMPDVQLSREEIQNIISYLETLRTDKSLAPLLPPAEQGVKPVYPEPT